MKPMMRRMMDEMEQEDDPEDDTDPAGPAEAAKAALDWLMALPTEDQRAANDEIKALVAEGVDYVAALEQVYDDWSGTGADGSEDDGEESPAVVRPEASRPSQMPSSAGGVIPDDLRRRILG